MPGRTLDYARGPMKLREDGLDARAVATSILVTRLTGLLVASIGLLGVLGWVLDLEDLKSMFIGPITMKFNAASCLLMAGLALLLLSTDRRPAPRYHILGYLLGLVVSVVGGMTLAEHITGRDLRIDQLFFTEER